MPLLFAITLFVSAFLMFLVEPMIAQMILPLLGGTPAVWNTCIVFFQAVLLAGYGYTHFTTTHMPVKRQTLLQACLLALPFVLFILPIGIGNWTPAGESSSTAGIMSVLVPVFSVLSILVVAVGLPFFVVATSAPLLQRWFSSTGHASAKDPYFLYGASNLGSMLALLSYPFFFQRNFDLPEMANIWTMVFAALLLLVGACGLVVWRAPAPATIALPPTSTEPQPAPLPAAETQQHVTRRPVKHRAKQVVVAPPMLSARDVSTEITWLRRLRWVGLAAAPSSLMLGLTTYLTTDIAPHPLIWIVPLALYLMSFIFVFARWPVPWTGPAKQLTFLLTHLVATFALGIVAYTLWEVSSFWIAALAMYMAAFVFLFMLAPQASNGLVQRVFVWSHIPAILLLAIFAFPEKNVLGAAGWDVSWGALVPLVLYIVPFILLFRNWPKMPLKATPHNLFVYIQPTMLLILGVAAFGNWGLSTGWIIGAHLAAFLTCIMVCHGELAKDRPPPHQLTEFYLWMSVGGVLGGIFNSLIAPLIFYQVIEYFLVLLLVLFLRPQTHFWSWATRNPEPEDDHTLQEYVLDIGYAACLGLLGYALLNLSISKTFWGGGEDLTTHLWEHYGKMMASTQTARAWARWTELIIIEGIPVAICLCFAGRPVRLGLAVLGLFIANYVVLNKEDPNVVTIYTNRSFFGVQRVRREVTPYGTYNVLIHGSIDHGRQNVDPSKRDQPISYFYPTNPCGQVFTQMEQLSPRPPFAVVGLGTGTLASYARPGQVAHFYEIDPAVLHLSEPADGSPPFFWYLQDAKKKGVKLDVILGDGRLKLKEAKENYYQVIVVDAFSSDAIPIHLLTVEAIELYLSKLKDDGILVFNITNRYFRLAPVLADVAKKLDLVCWEQGDGYDSRFPDKFSSDWAIVFRKPKNTVKLSTAAASAVASAQPNFTAAPPWASVMAVVNIEKSLELPQRLNAGRWQAAEPTGLPPWTDQYQDIIRAINW